MIGIINQQYLERASVLFKKLCLLFCVIFSFEICSAQETENIEYKYCLSIDGGGLRGVFPASVLAKIEEDSGQPIYQFFPAGMTGTSTGSLIVLGLSARKNYKEPDHPDYKVPLFTAARLVEFYKKHAEKIFECCTCANCKHNASDCFCALSCSGVGEILSRIFCCGCFACCWNCCGLCGPQYSNEYFAEQLIAELGHRTLKDVLVPVQVVAFAVNEGGSGDPIYFDTHTNPDLLMYQAALASAAAPTFFPPVSIELKDAFTGQQSTVTCVDGGIYENNPSNAALTFAVNNERSRTSSITNPSRESFHLLSIGTGHADLSENPGRLKKYGFAGWAKRVIEFGMRGTSVATDRHLQTMPQGHYCRIQVEIEKNLIDMDDPKVVDPLIKKVLGDQPNQGVIEKIKSFITEYERILNQEVEDTFSSNGSVTSSF